jgi:hypothetical protein
MLSRFDPVAAFEAALERVEQLGGLATANIFREPGDTALVNSLQADLQGGAEPRAVFAPCGPDRVHAVADLLKRLLRAEPLLGEELHGGWDAIAMRLEAEPEWDPGADILALVERVPEAPRRMLTQLVGLLQRVDPATGMDAAALGAVFAPCLVHALQRADAELQRMAKAGLDEGLLSLPLFILVCMHNPCGDNK